MKFKVNTSADAIKDGGGGGKFIGESGIYDVVINFASIEASKGGSESLNFNVDYNGNTQTFYGLLVQNNDGKENTIGMNLVNKLAIISGEESELTTAEEVHAVGKDNEDREFTVIEQFSNLPVKMRVQESYNYWNGEIKQRLLVKAFFREDGASAQEILAGNEEDFGTALEKEQKYASNITYTESGKGKNDAPTEEDVAAWKEAKRSGGGAAKASTATASTTRKRATFGKK